MTNPTCFGSIKHIFREADWYQLTTDIFRGEEVGVQGDVVDPLGVVLEVNDNVRISYILNEEDEENEDQCPITILKVTPIKSDGIGVVTDTSDPREGNEVIVDHKYSLKRTLLSDPSRLQLDAVVEYTAVQCQGNPEPYRITWAQYLSPQREQHIYGLHRGLENLLQYARDRNFGVRIKEPKARFEITMNSKGPRGGAQRKTITVVNMSTRHKVLVYSIHVTSLSNVDLDNFRVIDPVITEHQPPLEIPPEGSLVVTVEAFATEPGIYMQHLIVQFSETMIMRSLELIYGNESYIAKYGPILDQKAVRPTEEAELLVHKLNCASKWNRRCRTSEDALKRNSDYMKESDFLSKMRRMDDKWLLPNELKHLLMDNVGAWKAELDHRYSFIFEALSPANYREKLHHCIYVEEAELFLAFQRLSRKHVTFTECHKQPNQFLIAVADLEEQRPSLMVYDTVILIPSDVVKPMAETGAMSETEKRRYQKKLDKHTQMGQIMELRAEDILVQVDKVKLEVPYDVSFSFSRNQIIARHSAVERISRTHRFKCLFPDQYPDKPPLPPNLHVEIASNGRLYIQARGEDGQTEKRWMTLARPNFDSSQRRVIRNILRGDHRQLPYLIRGPPGTGKTTTLIEIILQLILHDDQAKILVCTQSNSAANLVLEKLVDSGLLTQPQDLLRLLGCNAYSAALYSEPKLWPFMGTFLAGKQAMGRPEVTQDTNKATTTTTFADKIQTQLTCAQVNSVRVIITTSGQVPQLTDHGVSSRRFTHLFVDEAAQCMEVDMLAPLALMENDRSQIVLVGDDKQLGPVVMCRDLEKSGFQVSLFERLMMLPMYRADSPTFNAELSNQLNYNYRSIPSILKLFNDLFYDSQLRPMVSEETGPEIDMLHRLQSVFPANPERRPTTGVLMYSVFGVQQRSASSPSWLNPQEASVVVNLASQIVKSGVPQSQIGVVTPYQGQVRYISYQLTQRHFPDIKVGSVEIFQGQERPIIILSAVRSSEDPLAFGDCRLGFIGNPKRLNVALSRAQSLLVIVGNPVCLMVDENWRGVINYCITRGACVCTEEELLTLLKQNIDHLNSLPQQDSRSWFKDKAPVISDKLVRLMAKKISSAAKQPTKNGSGENPNTSEN